MADKTSQRLILPPALASYAQLLEPKAFEQQDPKFSVQLLWDKSVLETDLKPLLQAINEVAIAKFGPQAPEMFKEKVIKHPLHRGDLEKADKPVYAGKIYANVSCPQDRKPPIIDLRGCSITSDADCYSGCTIRVSVGVYAYDKGGGRGVALALNSVQVVAKGERLDGHSNPLDAFKEFIDPNAASGVTVNAPKKSDCPADGVLNNGIPF